MTTTIAVQRDMRGRQMFVARVKARPDIGLWKEGGKGSDKKNVNGRAQGWRKRVRDKKQQDVARAIGEFFADLIKLLEGKRLFAEPMPDLSGNKRPMPDKAVAGLFIGPLPRGFDIEASVKAWEAAHPCQKWSDKWKGMGGK